MQKRVGKIVYTMSAHINASLRIKSYQSLKKKWNKNLGKSKQLREVINDIIGIRLIMNQSYEETLLWVNQLKKDCAYNIKQIKIAVQQGTD